MSRLFLDTLEILDSDSAKEAGWGEFVDLGDDFTALGQFALAFAGYEIEGDDELGNRYQGRESVRIDIVFHTRGRAEGEQSLFPVESAFAFLYERLAVEKHHTRIRINFPSPEEVRYIERGSSLIGGIQTFYVFAEYEANLTA